VFCSLFISVSEQSAQGKYFLVGCEEVLILRVRVINWGIIGLKLLVILYPCDLWELSTVIDFELSTFELSTGIGLWLWSLRDTLAVGCWLAWNKLIYWEQSFGTFGDYVTWDPFRTDCLLPTTNCLLASRAAMYRSRDSLAIY
jgi:hypothetical protein